MRSVGEAASRTAARSSEPARVHAHSTATTRRGDLRDGLNVSVDALREELRCRAHGVPAARVEVGQELASQARIPILCQAVRLYRTRFAAAHRHRASTIRVRYHAGVRRQIWFGTRARDDTDRRCGRASLVRKWKRIRNDPPPCVSANLARSAKVADLSWRSMCPSVGWERKSPPWRGFAAGSWCGISSHHTPQ